MIGAERFIPVISHAEYIVMRLVILGIAPDHVEYSGGFGQNREKTDTGLGFAFGNFERAGFADRIAAIASGVAHPGADRSNKYMRRMYSSIGFFSM